MSIEIALRAARVRYGPLEALRGVDLAVPAARLTVLLGRDGAGRSTVLRALAGTVPLAAGRVEWRGRDVTVLPAHVRARRGLVYVPDRGAVFPSLTVAGNLELASRRPRAYDRALDAYPALRALLGRPAGTLSGGERRMLAVSRALLSPARLVLLDEPVQGMSPATAAHTYALLGALVAGRGSRAVADPGKGAAAEGPRSVVVAEQSLPPALRAVTTVVHELRRGAVAFNGEPSEFPLKATTPRSRPPAPADGTGPGRGTE